jgi:site-specific DNA-methyltransferase (adenine-specific)
MKSVWEVLPPSREEKLFGKHPAQKPVALLQRIILASSNEGDLVLDPFMGSGTTLLSAFRIRRRSIGCEFEFESVSLSLRRICSDLIHAEISVSSLQIFVDLPSRSMDRSISESNRAAGMPTRLKLVQQECHFYFIGRIDRRVIFTAVAASLDEAQQKFRASGRPDSDALFVIKTQTEIFLAQ